MSCLRILTISLMGIVVAIQAVAQPFKGHVTSQRTGNTWTYALTNDEPNGSPLKGGLFYVTLGAPDSIGSGHWINPPDAPAGWSYDTDYRTWVAWFVIDTAPNSALVDPGETQGGFSITCTPPSGAVAGSALQPYYCQGADTAGPEIGPYGGGSVMAPTNSVGGIVSGTIVFDGRDPLGTVPFPVTFEFRPSGSQTVVSVESALVMPDGNFAVPGPSTPGSYDLSIKPLAMLRKTVACDTTGGGASSLALLLKNGDIDSDNEIAIGDYAILSLSYNLSLGDPGFEVMADLNADEAVDIADYAVLSANYGEMGDE